MAQKHTALEMKDTAGREYRSVSHITDSPLPPVAELERLHNFRPDLVDKVIDLTATEGEHRRKRFEKIDRYIFIQNLVSSVGSILVSLTAFGGAIYLAMNGHAWTSVALVGSTLGVVVYAISRANKK